MYIPFNKPYLCGKELDYIFQAVSTGKISGDGLFTKKCHEYFQARYAFKKCLLTTSCTDALEMCAILLDIKEGDEVIMPAFTFVSTANAFVLRGAKIIFCDSMPSMPNMDVDSLEGLITPNTKAIVVVHYAGIAVEMEKILQLAERYGIYVVEDAAQAIDSYYDSKPLGGIGHLAAFSFHETKNIQCGEGGMLVINDERFVRRSEIIREKGTNRSAFFRGEVDKYGWVDIGSSFLPSEVTAAFLYAQLENLEAIQKRRKQIWDLYHRKLNQLESDGKIQLPAIPAYATNNAHMFYVLCKDAEERDQLISRLKAANILAVFHYISLHNSSYYRQKHDGRPLPNCDNFSEVLLRLPLYVELSNEQVESIAEQICSFYGN